MASNFVAIGRMGELQRWYKNKAQFLITRAFDMAAVNSWLEYRLDAKRANVQTKDIQDLLHFKMKVAQCLVRV